MVGKVKRSKFELLVLLYIKRRPKGAALGAMPLTIGISIPQLVKAIRGLTEDNLIYESDDLIHLTREGKSWITENQSEFVFSGKKTWREVPAQFCQEKSDPSKPYAPLRSLLPKALL